MTSKILNKIKPLIYLASICYFLLLIYIVFLARRRRGRIIPEDDRLNLRPLINKWQFLFGNPAYLKSFGWFNFYSDFIGNIFLFIPLPIFLVFVLQMNEYKKVILLCFITSLIIETIQYVLRIGVADIDDVILNTTGAIAGVLIVMFIKKKKWA